MMCHELLIIQIAANLPRASASKRYCGSTSSTVKWALTYTPLFAHGFSWNAVSDVAGPIVGSQTRNDAVRMGWDETSFILLMFFNITGFVAIGPVGY